MYNPDVSMYSSEANRAGRRQSDRGTPGSPGDDVWFSRRMKHAAKQPAGPAAPAGDGIVLVDSTLKPIAVDKGAQAILDEIDAHHGGGDGGASLPRDILTALQSRTLSQLDAALMYVSAGGRSYSCRSFSVKSRTGGFPETVLALYLKRELSVAEAVHQVGVEYSLTDREQEALIGVAMGLTSKELAVRMKISPNTVKAFLRLIMVKMGATTRAGIVGRLLDSERSSNLGGLRE